VLLRRELCCVSPPTGIGPSTDNEAVQIAWRLGPQRLAQQLATAQVDELTSPSTGVLDDGVPPTGYVCLQARVQLGSDQRARDRLCRALMSWELHRAAGMITAPSRPAVSVGVTIVNAATVGPLALLAPCRVVAVLDSPASQGFVYATLPGHPLIGEELFVVQTAKDGRSCFCIRSFSRPVGIARRWPAVTRTGQRMVNRRYLAAARRIAA
jgi:uncharacterized protein (UPF0548 family)